MPTFATVEDLAEALEIRVTLQNQALLRDCLDAAGAEIEHFLEDAVTINPPQGLLVRTNVNRAVEWFKAPATYNGGVGFIDTGTLKAPTSGFERHAAALLPFKRNWGVA
jgi:hypothetical protein